MEIYHDSELEQFEHAIRSCVYQLRELLTNSGALLDPGIREIYQEPISELDSLLSNIDAIAGRCGECRVKFHQHPEFVRIYLEAYGDYHPDSDEYSRIMVEKPEEQD